MINKHRKWYTTLLHHSKERSKTKNLEFDLTSQDIIDLYDKQNGKCYWLGIDMSKDNSYYTPNQPSIDRLDNSKGYTKDNIVLACTFANLGRKTTKEEEFILFIDQLKRSINQVL